MALKQHNYRRLTMKCPHCEEQAIVEDSRPVTRICRDMYFRCSNLHCGFTFKAQLAVISEISPSSAPHPGVHLPKSPPRRRAGKLVPANDNDGLAVAPPAA
ncbi:ogr/Delta-like zinc finger family protein [Phenylobacterium sp.]|uniref:ogr/Delta-like zinc finger family protein n=1 Tax=Phenylobacterium sp. TaxID=1871053 RepID=UPI00301D1D45